MVIVLKMPKRKVKSLTLEDSIEYHSFMPVNRSKQITVRITAKMEKELKALANADRRTLADYVRLMIEDKLAESRNKR